MRTPWSLLWVLLFSASAPAAVVEVASGTSTVGAIYAYGDSEGSVAGHIVVDITDPINASVCRGVWIDKSDAQYPQMLQLLTTAKLSRSIVRVLGDSNRLFSGSSDKFCYLHIVGLL